MKTQSTSQMMRILLVAIVTGCLGVTVMAPPADAQRRNQQSQERSEQDRTFSTQIGELVLRAQEQMEADNYTAARQTLTQALDRNPSAYERSVILAQRGRVAFQLDDYNATITDFRGAINAGGLN